MDSRWILYPPISTLDNALLTPSPSLPSVLYPITPPHASRGRPNPAAAVTGSIAWPTCCSMVLLPFRSLVRMVGFCGALSFGSSL